MTEEDLIRADQTVPGDAPRWMRQEFAANFALRRAIPEARDIRVDRSYIAIDRRRFAPALNVYLCRGPYSFRLSRSRLMTRWHDLLSWLLWWR